MTAGELSELWSDNVHWASPSLADNKPAHVPEISAVAIQYDFLSDAGTSYPASAPTEGTFEQARTDRRRSLVCRAVRATRNLRHLRAIRRLEAESREHYTGWYA